jgi:AAA15 family ATPase/GTPase
MLISFSVKNFLSFNNKITFSMVASREKQHGSRVPRIRGYMRLLPVAAIYGGNASGKSNFVEAIAFARQVVVQGSQPDARIPVEPYRLDKISKAVPSTFIFEIFTGKKCYEYGFSITSRAVEKEWLVEILKTTEKTLYRRNNDAISFGRSLRNNKELLFLFKGTRENQLFLTNAVSQKNELFKSIYLWFRDTLILIGPDSRYGGFDKFLQTDSPLYEYMNDALEQMDTGICSLGGEELDFDALPAPPELLKKIKEDVQENKVLRFHLGTADNRYIASLRDGEVIVKKLVSYHKDSDGEKIRFDLQDESDGTLRILDLLPAFMAMSRSQKNCVFIIDELDRSLHTLLTRHLLESYLSRCDQDSRSQLIFTTHDALLMDQTLLRRDEMWVTERAFDGSSEMIAFSEYKNIRNDKDIRKSYLQGRLGGVPRILSNGLFRNLSTDNNNPIEL